MQNRWTGRLLATLALLAVVAGALWHFLNAETRKPAEVHPQMAKSDFKYHSPPKLESSTKEDSPEPERDGLPKIPREKVEEWLAKHNRNAMSLLAAFRALHDTNYLNEAATNFPNDPQVEWTILARKAFPEDRRQWLDRFKASSPSNALANYLSAQDYLKNGQPDAAVQELLAASGKPQFNGYETESRLDEEELCLASGKSPLESTEIAMAGVTGDFVHGLVTLNTLANGIGDLEKQSLNSGDNDSAANLAQMGMTLAEQLNSGDSGKYLVNQLVGFAAESIVLRQLDANTSYDFLNGKTPDQVLGEMKQQRASLNQLARSFDAIQSDMTESERVNFTERMKIYGEADAMRWAVQQHPPNNP
jgi:hypothetical protein